MATSRQLGKLSHRIGHAKVELFVRLSVCQLNRNNSQPKLADTRVDSLNLGRSDEWKKTDDVCITSCKPATENVSRLGLKMTTKLGGITRCEAVNGRA